jgi:hypothetical protein
MNNEEILKQAKRHQDALIGDGTELIGYEFSVASIIAFARVIMLEQMECDAKICELVRIEDGDGQHTQWYAGVDECIAAIRNQKVEG